MKKYLFFLAFVAMALSFSLTAVSCSDDDDVNVSKDELIGKWECVNIKGYIVINGEKKEYAYNKPDDSDDNNFIGEVREFNKNETFKEYRQSTPNRFDTGTWKVNGNKFTISYDYNKDESYTYTITTFKNDVIVLEGTAKEDGNDRYMQVSYKKLP